MSILVMVAITLVFLTIYVAVEAGVPGYSLSKSVNKDYPSEIVGVGEMHVLLMTDVVAEMKRVHLFL